MLEFLMQEQDKLHSSNKTAEPIALADGNGMGALKLSEIRKLGSGASKEKDWMPITGEQTPKGNHLDALDEEKQLLRKGQGAVTDGSIGIPEESPAYKALLRLGDKIDSEFPGKDEKSEELRQAALMYVMNKEGFGHTVRPDQMDLLKRTPGAIDKLNDMYIADVLRNYFDPGDKVRLYKSK